MWLVELYIVWFRNIIETLILLYWAVDGEYVEEGWVDKTCKVCKKDTKGEARQVDKLGRYVHVACAEKAKSGNFFTRLFSLWPWHGIVVEKERFLIIQSMQEWKVKVYSFLFIAKWIVAFLTLQIFIFLYHYILFGKLLGYIVFPLVQVSFGH